MQALEEGVGPIADSLDGFGGEASSVSLAQLAVQHAELSMEQAALTAATDCRRSVLEERRTATIDERDQDASFADRDGLWRSIPCWNGRQSSKVCALLDTQHSSLQHVHRRRVAASHLKAEMESLSVKITDQRSVSAEVQVSLAALLQ